MNCGMKGFEKSVSYWKIYLMTYIVLTELQIYRLKDLQTYRFTYLQIYRPTDLHTYRFTYLQIYSLKDLQTYRYTDLQI